eukprot:TRINITY_DN3315_c0_g2_i2.p1 TRINITY_DN3315_c0_g2~~TRINITY_DN3315_c0_g2_i2.p1  ORF type:complete len:416 (+),score=108.66 TRINITY_DN3315_c0_g2_i2:73-1248(+)
MRTSNPIRNIVDRLVFPKNPPKPIIHLSIGDPTRCSSLPIPNSAKESIPKRLNEGKFNGYGPSMGYDHIRESVAKSLTKETLYNKDDIIIGSGCSHALDMAFATLFEEGTNILIPKPGFSLYQTLSQYHNIEYKYYDLIPQKNWEIDLSHLEKLIDNNTRAILINNPSNPCGSNFTKEHLLEIIKLALKHKLPIISDEIYADMVFSGEFYSCAELTNELPVLVCGGLSKKYMMPGWRLGWILIHDPKKRMNNVREGLRKVSTTILGASSLVQSIVGDVIENTEREYFLHNLSFLAENAKIAQQKLGDVVGVKIIPPQAAMYMMIGIEVDKFKDFSDDLQFSQLLLNEQCVSILPGKCFNFDNYFRIVLCVERNEFIEAIDRIKQFCINHHK